MTLLRPEVHRGQAQVLDDRSPAELKTAFASLLRSDPIVNAVLDARLRAAGTLDARRLGGEIIVVPAADGIAAACFAGGNLLPAGGDEASWRTLAQYLGVGPPVCSSIVGRADAVAELWRGLERRWGPARAVRIPQPLLVADRVPAVAPDATVHPAQPGELSRYLPAAAAMFTEELGVSPHVSPGTAAFQQRMRHLIEQGRAFVSTDFRGQVVFKADIAAVSPHTAQVQGVWVRPDLRGRGIGTAGLAAVFGYALRLAPTVSLYVNGFNVAARHLYQRLGMTHHADVATVLLP
jgi:hypothetical protein